MHLFENGDLVKVKGVAGPTMIVIDAIGYNAGPQCLWFDAQGRVCEHVFWERCLDPANKANE